MKSRMAVLLMVVALGFLASGCAGTRALRPGRSVMESRGAARAEFRSEMKQPENPAQAASQNYERVTETELPLAKGTKVVEVMRSQDEKGVPRIVEKTIELVEPAVQKVRQVEKAGTSIGAAQKDTARELGAKLSNLKGVVWVGVLMFLFGIGALAYPPLRVAVGSVTTSAAILAGGLMLIVLPSVVVGNEMLILGGVGAGVGCWFLAHRHGKLRGEAEVASLRPPVSSLRSGEGS